MTKTSEAQKRAKQKYEKEKVKQINLKFYPSELAVYEHAKELGGSKIKELIGNDMA